MLLLPPYFLIKLLASCQSVSQESHEGHFLLSELLYIFYSIITCGVSRIFFNFPQNKWNISNFSTSKSTQMCTFIGFNRNIFLKLKLTWNSKIGKWISFLFKVSDSTQCWQFWNRHFWKWYQTDMVYHFGYFIWTHNACSICFTIPNSALCWWKRIHQTKLLES